MGRIEKFSAFVFFLMTAIPAANSQTVIPLTLDNNSNQLGISVRLGTDTNWFTYILDTGSYGFLSAMGTNSFWNGAFKTTDPSQTFSVSYGGTGALAYQGIVATTDVTFQTTSGGTFTATNVEMGAITNEPYTNWNANINSNPPAAPETPTDHKFFGTMGAGLSTVNTTGTSNGAFASILSQISLAAGLTQGFVVHTGGAGSTNATLTIGLTKQMINSFPTVIDMQASTGLKTNANGTVVNLYPQAQAAASYLITGTNGSNYSTTADLIMDTGGLDTHITSGSNINPPINLLSTDGKTLASGDNFNVSVAAATNSPGTNSPAFLSWTIDSTGTNAYQNQVSVLTGNKGGSLNTGIPLFYQYDVMFDTQHGVIGLMAVPEPSDFFLVLFAGGIITLTCRHRSSLKG